MSLLQRIPDSIKAVAGVISAIGIIIGAYLAADSWADSKVAQVEERIEQQQAMRDAKDSLIHDRIFQTSRAQYHESQLKIAELELAALEDEVRYNDEAEITTPLRVLRAIDRLRETIKYHDAELKNARTALQDITKIDKESAVAR